MDGDHENRPKITVSAHRWSSFILECVGLICTRFSEEEGKAAAQGMTKKSSSERNLPKGAHLDMSNKCSCYLTKLFSLWVNTVTDGQCTDIASSFPDSQEVPAVLLASSPSTPRKQGTSWRQKLHS